MIHKLSTAIATLIRTIVVRYGSYVILALCHFRPGYIRPEGMCGELPSLTATGWTDGQQTLIHLKKAVTHASGWTILTCICTCMLVFFVCLI